MKSINQKPILDAGFDAINSLAENIDKVFKHRPKGLTGDAKAIVSDPEISEALEALCSAQAKAYSCLFDDGNRSMENSSIKKLRLERVSKVRGFCKGLELSELRNRGPRNALAHFDEYLLKAIIKSPNTSFIQDLAFSHHDTFVVEPGGALTLIRVFMYDTDNFHIFDKTLNLRRLRDEIDSLGQRLGFEVGWKHS